jgi:hypothetical protein
VTTHTKGNSVTKTVSMSPDMSAQAENRAKSLGFRSFSAYVQHLLRGDLMTGGDLTLRETPVSYKTKPVSSERKAEIHQEVTEAVKRDKPSHP